MGGILNTKHLTQMQARCSVSGCILIRLLRHGVCGILPDFVMFFSALFCRRYLIARNTPATDVPTSSAFAISCHMSLFVFLLNQHTRKQASNHKEPEGDKRPGHRFAPCLFFRSAAYHHLRIVQRVAETYRVGCRGVGHHE